VFRDWIKLGQRNKEDRNISPGQRAEEFAARYLITKGLEIVVRNHADRHGEIDLIARQDKLLIFVEVRLRNHRNFASGAESVDFRKQRKIIATATQYLQKHYNSRPPPCRFDVVALKLAGNDRENYDVEWLQDAFRPDF
jgi:putative endonuclease